ncbi:MAG: flagellar hook-basal body protein [Schwartzia sp.]|nr:flagellar hook-basal body protein [Schwartzia sp. (in: firmicutes)]
MWRGLYTGATGMMTQQNRTSVIANNLANVNTTGYKRDRALDAEFHPMLIRRINDDMPIHVTDFKGFSLHRRPPAVGTLGLGAYTSEVAVDHAPGAFMTTGNPLDLAISGNGFFVIDTPQGLRYTRNGNFYRTPTGDLVTSDGQAVLSRQGRPINIPENATRIVVTPQGDIFADGAQVATLGFVEFGEAEDHRAMLKQGNSLFYPQEGAEAQPATGTIEQGVLERSNSNVVSEMVDLIDNYRIYEANSKAVTTQDSMLDHAVNEVGRLS